jgi:hypothetical protein
MKTKELIQKPTLHIAKKLFKRKNPNIDFNVCWKRKPTFINNCYSSTVIFKAKDYKNITMNLYSDIHETAIF